MNIAPKQLVSRLENHEVTWLPAKQEPYAHSDTIAPTELALSRAEHLWGKTDLTQMFRQLLQARGISLYDRKIEHHFTGSAIIIDPETRKILLTFHPWYKLWLQLGGHDEGENDPVAVSAREAWEESGIDDLWVCDWPVRVDPHPAYQCKSAPGNHQNYHYDICYMSLAYDTHHIMSDESVDMRWFSIDEIRRLVTAGKAQQRALEMAENSLTLLDALTALHNIPVHS
jgi:8-oxo-dGTP pyrophosphatase MutT (NUDIX family)